MNIQEIVQELDGEIERLRHVRTLLSGDGLATSTRLGPRPKKKRFLSAEARARIAAAQKARWAKQKRAAKAA